MNPNQTHQSVPGAGGIPQQPVSPSPEKKGMRGLLLAVVVVFLVLIAGYFLYKSMGGAPIENNLAPTTGTADTVVVGSQASTIDPNTVQGTSIDLTDIEKDLNATDLNTLSADLNAI
jgi:hypothetical protein